MGFIFERIAYTWACQIVIRQYSRLNVKLFCLSYFFKKLRVCHRYNRQYNTSHYKSTTSIWRIWKKSKVYYGCQGQQQQLGCQVSKIWHSWDVHVDERRLEASLPASSILQKYDTITSKQLLINYASNQPYLWWNFEFRLPNRVWLITELPIRSEDTLAVRQSPPFWRGKKAAPRSSLFV